LIENYQVGSADPQLPTNQAEFLQKTSNLSDVADSATARTNLSVPSTTEALLGANNLSDVADAATARANLGVPSEAEGLAAVNNLSDVASTATSLSNLGGSPTADILLVANNLSDITDPATARANLGVSSSGDSLLIPNNLSDLDNIVTARTNLGLGTAATTASTAYATAAQGVKADAALPKTGGAMTGAITTSSTFDGRDVATDGSKLDGIEALADVTDATNVVAAGGYIAGGVDVAIADGGTAASTEAGARANLEFQTNVTGGVTEVTVTSYTVLATDHTLTVDETAIGGNVTINLPAAATVGSGFELTVKKTGSTFSTTIEGDGTETIDGDLTYVLSIENESTSIVSNGTGWNLTSDTPPPIETTITDTDLAVPTSGAVVDYAQPADENIAGPTTDVTSTSYTVLSSDRILLVNDTTAGADVTINIPSAATLGDGWQLVVKKVGTDFDVILDADGTETIDGALTRSLHQKNDTFVIVSDGTNWEIAARNVVLGWANYVDSTYTSGSPLQLNAGNSYVAQCTVNGLGSGSTASEWPDGVPEPWDKITNKLVGTNDGDKFTYELSFKAQDGAASVLMDVYIDIGGAIGEISRSSVSIAKGAAVETAIEMYRTYFTGSTFVTNGGTIYFDTSQGSDTMDIWDIALLIEKTHVAS